MFRTFLLYLFGYPIEVLVCLAPLQMALRVSISGEGYTDKSNPRLRGAVMNPINRNTKLSVVSYLALLVTVFLSAAVSFAQTVSFNAAKSFNVGFGICCSGWGFQWGRQTRPGRSEW